MTAPPVVAADVSVYSGQISAAQWRHAHHDHGVDVAVVGLWHGHKVNTHAAQQATASDEVGLGLAAYIAITGRQSPTEQVTIGLRQLTDHDTDRLAFVALDVELAGVTAEQVQAGLDAIRRLGQRPCIYTYPYFWRSKMADTAAFADVPLWHARYYGDGHRTLEVSPPYGGWRHAVGHQFTDKGARLLGFDADLSIFDAAWLNDRNHRSNP